MLCQGLCHLYGGDCPGQLHKLSYIASGLFFRLHASCLQATGPAAPLLVSRVKLTPSRQPPCCNGSILPTTGMLSLWPSLASAPSLAWPSPGDASYGCTAHACPQKQPPSCCALIAVPLEPASPSFPCCAEHASAGLQMPACMISSSEQD